MAALVIQTKDINNSCNSTLSYRHCLKFALVWVSKVYFSVYTGIEEAFLQVAKKLIKLYETSPTSGLHSNDQSEISTADTDIKISRPSPSHTKPPPEQTDSRCSC